MNKLLLAVLLTILSTTWVSCTISGLSYMDPINFKPFKALPDGDLCHPLYWYPRHIPEYCYNKNLKPGTKPQPIPVPIPLPLPPQPMPFPMPPMSPQYPMPQTFPMQPPYPMPVPYPIPPPIQMFPTMPLPYGIPLEPSYPMLPVAGIPGIPMPNPRYSYRTGMEQAGMVPGLPGLVTQDGGVNILPFSDAYADVLEKHKQKILRKKLKRVLDDYGGYPRGRRHRRG